MERMNPRLKSALLWGAVGAMAFLVLLQGYALVVEPLVSIGAGVVIAVCVGTATGIGAYVLEHRLAARATARVDSEPSSDGKSKS
ncbi:hypothetical protein C480_11441 [Natrialba aegyptia DSM 13077]|uniref:DUF7981 domain-containing protein n=2 Tax=Natrialba aegyptia TaxID=129789 RepID=M0B1L1_9EURY|nr:hypothetical protein C480_11441 [Natrialba aegyptia DSM 13077]